MNCYERKEFKRKRESPKSWKTKAMSRRLDRARRNADYGIIRLTFVNIVEHAVVRHIASLEKSSLPQLFHKTIENFSPEFKAKLPFVT